MYQIVGDDDGHWYVIPVDRRKEFEDWLDAIYQHELDDEGNRNWDRPDWARLIDGPQSLRFDSYEIG